MKTMKFIICILITITSTTTLCAQPHERTGYYEEQGEILIKKAGDKIKSYNSLTIDFTYIHENISQEIYETSPGKIFIQGNKYNIKSNDYQYISDGETVWVCLIDAGEIHVSYADDIDQSMNPVHLLEEFQEHYRAKLIRQENVLGNIVNLVDAIPNQPRSFFKYRVAISDSDNMLSYIKAYDRHGGTYKIQFDEVKKNMTIPEEKFVFDENEYPDMDIIDLR